ncbi:MULTISPECIES: hypothetical protein [Pseudomonas]|uniref:hypothetical protein n=1 Tax=Pseudomonas TaxID=286 RepID=UPI0003E574C5|nr:MULTISPECIES: hypothetical protein [unclassified Pseudomonas]MBB1605446.1 hypothetical protein [Pseudomonas sp. UMC76]MBB1641391.1 hypothetical protein [Pseudomonas sp. UME83]NTX89428.1 hypothetical protein [Pseudomonas sp. UMA643]NTY19265.1 hypothetical protein [Pseudomonas sp. UMC3103]NTY24181.1 hypothetical protein [Pseudomonas sp. UMA603]
MKIECRQAQNAHGIVFSLMIVQLVAAERNRLRSLNYDRTLRWNQDIAEFVLDVFDYMQARGRLCMLGVLVSEPLSREQADALNHQRVSVANAVAGIATAAGSRIHPIAGLAMGAASRRFAFDRLPTYHIGDRIVGVDAVVSGGIGPQRSTQSMLLKTGASRG